MTCQTCLHTQLPEILACPELCLPNILVGMFDEFTCFARMKLVNVLFKILFQHSKPTLLAMLKKRKKVEIVCALKMLYYVFTLRIASAVAYYCIYAFTTNFRRGKLFIYLIMFYVYNNVW